MKLSIKPDGTIQFIYSDDLQPLLSEGIARIARASHVEPIGTQWQADMSPVNGPILGPFATRKQALDEEVQWLTDHLSQVSL